MSSNTYLSPRVTQSKRPCKRGKLENSPRLSFPRELTPLARMGREVGKGGGGINLYMHDMLEYRSRTGSIVKLEFYRAAGLYRFRDR